MKARTLIIRLAKSAYFRTPLWRFLLPIMKFDRNIAQLLYYRSDQVRESCWSCIGDRSWRRRHINCHLAEESINRPFYAVVTLEYIKNYTIQNKKNLESSGDEFRRSLEAITADPAHTREYLLRISMIASLRRAEE